MPPATEVLLATPPAMEHGGKVGRAECVQPEDDDECARVPAPAVDIRTTVSNAKSMTVAHAALAKLGMSPRVTRNRRARRACRLLVALVESALAALTMARQVGTLSHAGRLGAQLTDPARAQTQRQRDFLGFAMRSDPNVVFG